MCIGYTDEKWIGLKSQNTRLSKKYIKNLFVKFYS